MLRAKKRNPFFRTKNGRRQRNADPPVAEQIDFFVGNVDSDNDIDIDNEEEMAMFEMNVARFDDDDNEDDIDDVDIDDLTIEDDRYQDEFGCEAHRMIRRARRQKSVCRVLVRVLVGVLCIGAIALAWKVKNDHDKEQAFLNKWREDHRRTILCANGADGTDGAETQTQTETQTTGMSLDRWLRQDASNITALCDPIFRKHGTTPARGARVKVFVMMGEANMVGAGRVRGNSEGSLEYTVTEKGRFAHLMEEGSGGDDKDEKTGSPRWTKSQHVRLVEVREDFNVYSNDWLGIRNDGEDDTYFGIEQQFGYVVGSILGETEPVLIIKSASGHNALGGELLPPHSLRHSEGDGNGNVYVYPGFGESPRRWKMGGEPPVRDKDGWYAGMKYREYVENVRGVLKNLGHYYPGGTTFEISGFVWWQGDSDRRASAYAHRYGANLDRLIRALRHDFLAPDAKFVVASLGQDGYSMEGNTAHIFEAQMAVASPSSSTSTLTTMSTSTSTSTSSSPYSENQQNLRNVAAVDIRAAWRGDVLEQEIGGYDYDAAHYGNHAETFLEVGNAVGLAMARLLLE
mmetsp:Transcript_28240/g.66291  ORF Transcript_28240/g.66291 Transcript_28240/m.66291 type:complete len:572 (+) Transcript_28240:247-1962(+)